MATPRRQVLNLVQRHGADLTDRPGDGFDVNVWAPAGVMWNATECHSLSSRNYTDRNAGWFSLLDDLKLGVSPCNDATCDTCNPTWS